MTWLDLKDGPMVVESAPNTLGILDDFFFGHVTDLGNTGPDRGKGGKFLILPPGYDGEVPEGYYTFTSRTHLARFLRKRRSRAGGGEPEEEHPHLSAGEP